MRRSWRARVAALAWLCLAAACSPADDMDANTTRTLAEAARNTAAGQTLDLGRVADFAWDRVLVAGPYTPPEDIEKALGTPLPASARQQRLDERDDIVLLLFADGPRVVRTVPLPRDSMDLGKADLLQPLPRAQARFTRTPDGHLFKRAP